MIHHEHDEPNAVLFMYFIGRKRFSTTMKKTNGFADFPIASCWLILVDSIENVEAFVFRNCRLLFFKYAHNYV